MRFLETSPDLIVALHGYKQLPRLMSRDEATNARLGRVHEA